MGDLSYNNWFYLIDKIIQIKIINPTLGLEDDDASPGRMR